MIEVNLLPLEDRVRRAQHQPIFSIATTLATAIAIVLTLVNTVSYFANKRQLAFAADNLQSIRLKNDQAKSITEYLEGSLRAEAALIRSMLSNEINWSQALGLISTRIPSNLWLSKLELKDEPKGWTLTLIGFARPVASASAISSVGDFTNALKSEMGKILAKDNISADIELLTTTKRKMADRVEIVEFKAAFVRSR
ncbi:MAG: hypothetical protein HY587_04875 [Candidatus Omnitrophica bacterium]|nr:hypothetical protein [Candidatus Omnitrophota bacterium]